MNKFNFKNVIQHQVIQSLFLIIGTVCVEEGKKGLMFSVTLIDKILGLKIKKVGINNHCIMNNNIEFQLVRIKNEGGEWV